MVSDLKGCWVKTFKKNPGIVKPTKNFMYSGFPPSFVTSFAYMEPNPERRKKLRWGWVRHIQWQKIERTSNNVWSKLYHLTASLYHGLLRPSVYMIQIVSKKISWFSRRLLLTESDIVNITILMRLSGIHLFLFLFTAFHNEWVVAWAEPLTLTAITVPTLQSSPPRTWRSLLVYENVVTSSTTLGYMPNVLSLLKLYLL